MTAFNCASYLSLVVQSQRDGLDLLRRGGSSHRQQGNLGLSTSLYTPCIVRFCSLDPTISVCFLMVAACTVERGLSSESNSVSGPPTPSKRLCEPLSFQCDPQPKPINCRGFHRVRGLLEVHRRGQRPGMVGRGFVLLNSKKELVCWQELLLGANQRRAAR